MFFCKSIVECATRIRDYCEKQPSCQHCRFNILGSCVFLDTLPAKWPIPKEKDQGGRR